MKPRRDDITPQVAALSHATDRALDAAGNARIAGAALTVSDSQISRCKSTQHGDTLSLRDAQALDDLTLGRGGPHILHAYAAMLDHVAVPMPPAFCDKTDINEQLMTVAAELGDVSRVVIDAARDGEWVKGEYLAALDQADELVRAAVAMRTLFHKLAYPDDASIGGAQG